MPRRLLLDGDDLPTLMQRVRAELGPEAVVVKAERVRTGGVAGFFAKERFELTVEVPDARTTQRPTTAATTPAPRPGAVGLSALLDAADAGDDGAPAPSGPAGPAGTTGGHDPAVPLVSTDGERFASLLASIDDMADAHPSATPDPGRPAAPGVPSPHPAARFAPQGAAVTAAMFAPLDAPAVPAGPADAGDADTAPPGEPGHEAREDAVADDAPAAATPRRSADRPAFPPAHPPADPPADPPAGGDRRALLALGVPPAVVGAGPLDEPLPLSRLLAGLPRPPALLRAAGAVVAVVGEGDSALPVALGLAQRARLDARDVARAGAMSAVAGHGRRLGNPAAAARHRARAAELDTVSIVAIGVRPEADDWSVAADLLAELAPDQTWAVVDARRKTSDLRAWLRGVTGGRPVDAVAAAWVHETREPGTVLDLGAPVGWLDGLPATPVVWAAVLSERLDAGTRWD